MINPLAAFSGIFVGLPCEQSMGEPTVKDDTTGTITDGSVRGGLAHDPAVAFSADSDSLAADSLAADSLAAKSDSALAESQAIEEPVVYSSVDSIVYSLSKKKVFLHNTCNIQYKDITLDADYISFDMTDETVYAEGVPDSTGRNSRPVFTEGDQKFDCKNLYYNFKTKKGLIRDIFAEEEGGYLHSAVTKRQPNEHIHIRNGKYTTCDALHPHYYIALTRAVSIPNDKIVSGPAYIVLEDVPLPIGIPFGFFPNTREAKSGILMPQYGEEARRGFFLRNGGYYLAASQYFDVKLQGDIYSNGTWAASIGSKYNLRYRFNGNFLFKYANNVTGEKGVPGNPEFNEQGYSKSRDFSLTWSHSKDPKSNPTQSFSASVNFSSSSFDENHSRNINNVLRSTKQSSINYSKVWPNTPFNLSGSLNASQNSQTRQVNLRTPQLSFSMNTIYPLRRKDQTGKTRFWENLQVSYSSTLDNRLSTHEDSLFSSTLNDFDMAYRHNIPVSLNLKALKFFTVSPSVRYTGVLFTKSIHPMYIEDYVYPETGMRTDTFLIDTVQELRYAHAYVPSFNVNFSPKIYGIYNQFREKSRIEAIRHVMTPTASFSYVPDMKGKVPNYYQEAVVDSTGRTRVFPLFDQSVYSVPVPNGRSGNVSLSLRNNVEMKLKPESDTTDEFKKVKLLDNLSFTTNYGVFKDSLKWSPISMTGNTRFFNNKLSLNFGGTFDPYDYTTTESGRFVKINRSLYSGKGQLLRMTDFHISLGTSFKGGQGNKKDEGQNNADEQGNDPTAGTQLPPNYEGDIYYGDYVDFDIPWTFSADYTMRYSKRSTEPTTVQSLRFRGDFSLTPKWKIGFNSGYDFTAKKMSTTNISIYRDLHCWEMNATVVPFGRFRSYSFQINIKASVLHDLKYEKSDSWYDNF